MGLDLEVSYYEGYDRMCSGLLICSYSHCSVRAPFVTLALYVLLMLLLLCSELVQWKELFGAELTSIGGG